MPIAHFLGHHHCSKRAVELASTEAAAQAAKADALVRALRRAESNRDTLQRLRAENDALRELLLEVAVDKDTARARMDQVLSSLGDQALVERTRVAVAGGLVPPPISAAELLARPQTLPQTPGKVGKMAAAVAAAAEISDSAVTAAVEAKLVEASAQVAESISPSKVIIVRVRVE